jgi:hypothetical protein
MHKIYVALVIAAMAAIATPVNAASEDTHAKNVAFLTELVGNYDTAIPVEFADGTVMTLGEAISLAADRAAGVDLGALANSAVAGAGLPVVGDVWVLEVGNGDCAANVAAPQPLSAGPHPQAFLYAGGVGDLTSSHGYYTLLMDWTTKFMVGGSYANTAGFTATGSQDFWCFGFFGTHVAFPFLDGVASLN